MRDSLEFFTVQIEEHFLLRWILANMIGWPVALHLGSWSLGLIGGPVGLLAGGAAAGLLVGAFQRWALRPWYAVPWRRWLLLHIVGGGLGAMLAYASGFSIIAGPSLASFIVGAVFGATLSALQHVALENAASVSILGWVAANAAAGGFCGWLSLHAAIGPPAVCSPGPIVFGLCTGLALARLAGKNTSAED